MKNNSDCNAPSKVFNNPTIDIITPIWNGGRWVGQYMHNLLSQTYQNYKIFFVDDQSTDGTYEVLKETEKKYPDKVIVLQVPVNGGQGKARDFALDSGLVTADYLLCLDIDDIQEPEFLETLIRTAVEYDVDMVMCGLDCFDDKTGQVISTQLTTCPEEVVRNIKDFHEIAYMNPAVWNKLYRREVIKDYRYGNAKDVEDGIYLMRVLPSIKSIKFVNKVLFHYRIGNQSALARLTGEKFKDRWSYYTELSAYINSHSEIYKDYMDIFELQTFIKCGMGLTHRVAFKDMKHMNRYVKYSKKKLDELIPGWRKNRYLQIRNTFGSDIKEKAVAVCALLYKINCFEVFIVLYWLYKKMSKKDIRW